MNTKRMALLALLTAIALTIFIAESQIPAPIPVPGVKLGLANIVTLFTLCVLSRRDALIVLLMRVFLGSIFSGNFSAVIFSLSGGLLSWSVMSLLLDRFTGPNIWILSVLGAIAHNTGQLFAAALITRTPGIFYYAPVLLASAVATGAFCGLSAMYLLRRL